MNTKKSKTIALLLGGSVAFLSAQAQQASEVVAAWDFSQFAFDGFPSVDGTTLAGSINSNYTDFEVTDANGDVINGPNHDGAHQFGTMYWDGSFGSTAMDNNFATPNDVNPSGTNDLTAANGVGFPYTIGSAGSRNVLVFQGQEHVNGKGLAFTSGADGKSFVFGVSLTGDAPFSTGGDWVFRFGAKNSNDPDNASTITWEYSLDGTDYTDTGITSDVTDSESEFTVDLSGVNALVGASELFLRGTLSGLDGGNTVIDNFSASASSAGQADGSLFILDNPASSLLVEDWYQTPMGDLFTGDSPWLWSNDYGWTYSSPNNTSDSAFVYILSAPFQTWVFVDAASADELGFWGFAFNAANPDINGWFFFLNEASTDDTDEFFLWDNEGQQFLAFDDQSEL